MERAMGRVSRWPPAAQTRLRANLDEHLAPNCKPRNETYPTTSLERLGARLYEPSLDGTYENLIRVLVPGKTSITGQACLSTPSQIFFRKSEADSPTPKPVGQFGRVQKRVLSF